MKRRFLLLALFSLAHVLLLPDSLLAQQATLTDDAYTSANGPNRNLGSDPSLDLSAAAGSKGFLRFRLTQSLPPGTVGGHIGKATLKLFVGRVTTPGAIEIRPITGAWTETNITDNTAPPLGPPVGPPVNITAGSADKWVTIDLTQMVKDWLDKLATEPRHCAHRRGRDRHTDRQQRESRH